MGIEIRSAEAFIPPNIMFSKDIDHRLGKPEGWVEKLTGIKSRPVLCDGKTQVKMASNAAKKALDASGLSWKDIDCIISASATKEQMIPSQSCLIKEDLKLDEEYNIACFDIDSSCLSFVTALDIASCFIDAKKYKNIMIISSEYTSLALNWEHIESAALFGDMAVAFIISHNEYGNGSKVLFSKLQTFSCAAHMAEVRAGGTKMHAREYSEKNKNDFLFNMNGLPLYKVSAKYMPKIIEEALKKSNLTMNDINLVIPHQASVTAMDLMCKKLKIPKEKMVYTIFDYGNNVAASIPFAFKTALDQGRISKGDKIMIAGTSAGLSLGVMIIEY